MSDKEILEKAIQKAIDGGWKATLEGNTLRKIGSNGKPYAWIGSMAWSSKDVIFNHDFARALWGGQKVVKFFEHYVPARGYPGEGIDSKERKDFIEPLKGENGEIPEYLWYCTRCKKPWKSTFNDKCEMISGYRAGWQHYLQRMVVADDPIKYLGEHMND